MVRRQLDLDLRVQIRIGEHRPRNGCRMVCAEIEQEAACALRRLIGIPESSSRSMAVAMAPTSSLTFMRPPAGADFRRMHTHRRAGRSMPSVRSRLSSLSELA